RPPRDESASDENGRSVQVNLALSDEQVLLREAARGALSRFKTLEVAREALDGNEDALPDLWQTAKEAGWPGLLIDEEHGGAGLDAFDAMLVLGECGRVLASIPLLGHLVASAILNDAPAGHRWRADRRRDRGRRRRRRSRAHHALRRHHVARSRLPQGSAGHGARRAAELARGGLAPRPGTARRRVHRQRRNGA